MDVFWDYFWGYFPSSAATKTSFFEFFGKKRFDRKKKKSKKVFFLQKQENGKTILPSLQHISTHSRKRTFTKLTGFGGEVRAHRVWSYKLARLKFIHVPCLEKNGPTASSCFTPSKCDRTQEWPQQECQVKHIANPRPCSGSFDSVQNW